MYLYTLPRKVYQRIRRLYRRGFPTLYHQLRSRHLNLPIIFGNSFPKSGTRLLFQILGGFETIGPFLNRETFIHTYDDRRRTGYRRPSQEILRDIHRLIPGEIAHGHLYATRENISVLIRPNIVNYFIYRDPRDVVISLAFYAVVVSSRIRHYYAKVLNSLEERITTTILGVPDPSLEAPDIRSRFEPYSGWLDVAQVMPIRFEHLILDRKQTIGRIVDHFMQVSGYQLSVSREEAVDALARCIDPGKSPTFREGKVGSWRKHFTDEHKRLFKEVAGDLLIQLGYERDMDW